MKPGFVVQPIPPNNPAPIGCSMPGWERYAECNPPYASWVWANYRGWIVTGGVVLLVGIGAGIYGP